MTLISQYKLEFWNTLEIRLKNDRLFTKWAT